MTIRSLVQSSVVSVLGALVLASGCDQHGLETPAGTPSLSVQFAAGPQAAPPEALARIVERVRTLSAPAAQGGASLRKSLSSFTPDEARIVVLDASRWENEELLYSALAYDSDTLYNYSALNLTGDMWDNMVALFKGYTGTTYRFAGEHTLPVFAGAGRGVIIVNPGLNMFFAALREGRRTLYLYFSIQTISAEGDNTLILSPFDIVQRLLNNVGLWDPTSGWHALDGGINGEVLALEFVGGNLIAGGSFSVAGSAPANNIAAFDTANRRWLPMGAGLNGPVSALAFHSNALYALSNSRPGVTPQSSGLFRWSAGTWTPIGATFSGHGHTLASDGTNLYVGGEFASAGAVTMNNVAVWTDTSIAFSPLAGGTNGRVYAIATGGAGAPLAFMGGLFTRVNAVPPLTVSHLAVWDTRLWSTVGTGISGVTGTASVVRALLYSGTELYVGGFFSQAEATPANNIALYNGNTWIPLGQGIDGQVRALASDGASVYAGGLFLSAEGFEVNNVAVWSGFGWWALDSGLDGPVNAIKTAGPAVFVGGSFRYTK